MYDIDSVDGNIVGELERRNVKKYENTVRLLRYNNHICYVTKLMQSSNLFAALILTLSSTKLSIWSNISLHVVME